MLDENKLIYEEFASTYLPDWKTQNKNDLIRTASKLPDGVEKDAYVAAIMLKYWNKISKFYAKCSLVTTKEDIHEWLTTAILYAINKHPWDSPTASIYNDPNGPDKVVNRGMECVRLTFYQQLNRYNRKINSAILSLDSLTEDYKDAAAPTYLDAYIYEVHDIIIQYFNSEEHVLALMLNAILYENWDINEDNAKRTAMHLKKLDLSDAKVIAERYSIDENKVLKSIKYCNNLTIDELRRRVQYSFVKLRTIIKELN